MLFAIATLDLLPEAVGVGLGLHKHEGEEGHHDEHGAEGAGAGTMRTAMLGVAGGFFLLLAVEHTLTLMGFNHTHASTHKDEESREREKEREGETAVSPSFVLVTLSGLGVHSFVDGLVIAGAYRASASIGLRVAIAIILHKFPDGFVLSSLVSSAALAPFQRRLYYGVFAVLLMTPLGALAGAFLLNEIAPTVLAFVLGFGAGTFVFLSATAILPEILHAKPHRPVDLVWIAAGYLLFTCLETVTPGHAH